MPLHPLTNFEIQKYHQNKSKFNGDYSKKILSKINVINLDEYKSIGTLCTLMMIMGAHAYYATYFDSFGVEDIPKEIRKFIGHKNVITNRIQPYDLIMCGYFCIELISFMLKIKVC